MNRSVLLFLVLSTVLSAQEPSADPLTALRQTAERANAQWEALAKALEPKIARLLPCDPTSRAAVADVSHASEARLSALSAYMKAAAAQAAKDTEAAKKILATQAALGGDWTAERVESDQQHMALEGQIADLKESMRKRSALAGADKVLVEIANMVQQRSTKADEQAGRKDLVNGLLGDLVTACQDRQAALEKEAVLLETESARWTAYYTARLSRAVTECAIINQAPARKRVP